MNELLALWQAALDAEVGISVETDNRKVLQQHLYRARAEADNPEFDDITIFLPENEGELWLVHRDASGTPGTNNQGHLKLVR